MTIAEHPQLRSTVDAVKTETKDRLAYVTLERPETFNALSLEMIELMDESLSRLLADPYITSVIINSSSGNFCAGLDFLQLYNQTVSVDKNRSDISFGRKLIRRYYELLYRIHTCQKAILAICPGVCAGNGLSLAHEANGILTNFPLNSFPSSRMGYFPDAGLCRHLANFKYNHGLFFAMTGYKMEPFELIHHGLIKKYVYDFKPLHRYRIEVRFY